MKSFSNSPLGRFRFIAICEGISYLILLFIAVPLKRFAGMPEMVKYTGWAHGLLFILYVILLLQVMVTYKWSLKKAALAFMASLVPFGAFYLDPKLKKEEIELGKS